MCGEGSAVQLHIVDTRSTTTIFSGGYPVYLLQVAAFKEMPIVIQLTSLVLCEGPIEGLRWCTCVYVLTGHPRTSIARTLSLSTVHLSSAVNFASTYSPTSLMAGTYSLPLMLIFHSKFFLYHRVFWGTLCPAIMSQYHISNNLHKPPPF